MSASESIHFKISHQLNGEDWILLDSLSISRQFQSPGEKMPSRYQIGSGKSVLCLGPFLQTDKPIGGLGGARQSGSSPVVAENALPSRCVSIFLMTMGSSRQLLPAWLYLLHPCSRMLAATSLEMTCMDTLMPRAHGCAGAVKSSGSNMTWVVPLRQGVFNS